MSLRRRLLVWLMTVTLILQGMPAAAIMIGCTMAKGQATCSKWGAPSGKSCCCMHRSMASSGCPMRTAGKKLLPGAPDKGCECQFIDKSTPTEFVKQEFTHFLPTAIPAVLPAALFLPVSAREPDPCVLGTDSSPPRAPSLDTNQPRGPPVDSVRPLSS